jgi:hypothetical protein
MLWYKSWLDTRWRFAIGFVLLGCGAWLAVFGYPRLTRLVAAAPPIDTSTAAGRELNEIVALTRGFTGYVWSQWFRQTAANLGSLFAVLLGSGGLFTYGGSGELYTLSLPAPRGRLLFTRAWVGLAELLLLAVVPSLIFTVMAPAIGERYALVNALVHATCLFASCAVLFSLALLLSTSYADVWRPMLITLAVAMVIALVEVPYRAIGRYSITHLMNGETYFRTGRVPWLGLAAAAALSAALIATAAVNVNRRDY